MGTKISRERKQNWLWSEIILAWKTGSPLFVEDLLAKFSLENFSSERTGLEILRSFERTGRIEVLSHGDKNEIRSKTRQ